MHKKGISNVVVRYIDRYSNARCTVSYFFPYSTPMAYETVVDLSNMMTVSAAVRFSPRPPAFVDRSMMKRLNEELPNRFTESFLSDALVLPSKRS